MKYVARMLRGDLKPLGHANNPRERQSMFKTLRLTVGSFNASQGNLNCCEEVGAGIWVFSLVTSFVKYVKTSFHVINAKPKERNCKTRKLSAQKVKNVKNESMSGVQDSQAGAFCRQIVKKVPYQT